MIKQEDIYNLIFRDTMLGVLSLIIALMLISLAAPIAGSAHAILMILSPALAINGIYFLQKAFRRDKYRGRLL